MHGRNMCGIRVSEVVSRDDCRNVWLNDHEVCKNKISGVPTDILLDLQAWWLELHLASWEHTLSNVENNHWITTYYVSNITVNPLQDLPHLTLSPTP